MKYESDILQRGLLYQDPLDSPAKPLAHQPEGTAGEAVPVLPTIDRHLLMANQAIGKRHYELAVTELSCALKLDPSRADLIALRGDAWRALGQTDEAIADYTASLNLNPECE